ASATSLPTSALDFAGRTASGEPAHVTLPRFVPADPITVELFATPRSTAEEPEIRELWVLQSGFALQQRSGEWVFKADGGGGHVEIKARGVDAGRRAHIACVSTGKEMRLFVDGRLASKSLVSIELGREPRLALLGSQYLGPNFAPCDGTIDEVRISKTA